jgi:hypothetical protein
MAAIFQQEAALARRVSLAMAGHFGDQDALSVLSPAKENPLNNSNHE